MSDPIADLLSAAARITAPKEIEGYSQVRQMVAVAKMIPILTSLISEASATFQPAPGLHEARDWLLFSIEENQLIRDRQLGKEIAPFDPVADAVAASTRAASQNNGYNSARLHEAAVRLSDSVLLVANGDEKEAKTINKKLSGYQKARHNLSLIDRLNPHPGE